MIRSIIVDDEEKNRETLRLMLEQYSQDVEVVGMADNIGLARELIEKLKPQLVFLDVEMPPHTGFDLLKSIPHIDFEIIFVTAFNYYAIDAIKFSALYYILKPIKIDELREAIDKAKQKLSDKFNNKNNLQVLFQQPENINKLVINTVKESIVLELNKILYMEADNTYTKIIHQGGHILSSKPIVEYEKMLTNKKFYRTHKSFLINLNHISKYNKSESMIILDNGDSIPLAVRRKDEFSLHFKN